MAVFTVLSLKMFALQWFPRMVNMSYFSTMNIGVELLQKHIGGILKKREKASVDITLIH